MFRYLVVGTVLFGLLGCGVEDYDASESRTNSADENSRQIGSCGYFANPSGRYLFSIDTNISPGTPLLFESILLVNTEVEPRTAQLT